MLMIPEVVLVGELGRAMLRWLAPAEAVNGVLPLSSFTAAGGSEEDADASISRYL